MCGIFGLFTSAPPANLHQSLQTSLACLSHRGPDNRDEVLCAVGDGLLALGHTRLSIIDLSPSGHQPMRSQDQRYTVIFNGEIYNYLELKNELHTLGYVFNSDSDTEALLYGYAEWGSAVLDKLVGMFAFAILDTKSQHLFLARDYFGIKPLYYILNEQYFAFASEIPALLQLPYIKSQANPQAVYHYLHGNQTDYSQSTLFKDIYQLLPAHYLNFSLKSPYQVKLQRYWDIPQGNRLDISFDEASEHLRELFLQNVQLHLRSDVPVGAALSGGIDSSSIVMAMRHLQGQSLDLHTFSYVADQAEVNEEAWVDQVNVVSGAVAHKVHISATELVLDLEKLIAAQGEPFGSTSIYAQYRVFQLANKVGIKVMLDGQGADELFGGYRPYLAARLTSLIVQGHYKQAYQFLQKASQLSGVSVKYLLARVVGLLLPEQWQLFARYFVGRQTYLPWMNNKWVEQYELKPMSLRLSRRQDVLQEQLYKAMTHASLPMLLRYEDRNSMAHSIESRVPFLTPALAEFIFALPEEFLISADGTSKHIFRHAMRGIVPDAILDRRDKIGFATPEQAWMTQLRPWFEAALSSEIAHRIPIFNLKQMQRIFSAMVVGKLPFDFCVWRWVNLIRWAEYFKVDFEV